MARPVQVLLSSLLLCLVTLTVSAEPLTTAEREKLLEHLETTRHAFLVSVDGLTEEQWNYRGAEGRWTIAEVAEHIAAAEKMLRGLAEGTMKEPAAAEMLKDARQDAVVLQRVTDRSEKFQAPDPLKPVNRFGSPAAALAAFRSERAATLDLATRGGDLRAYAAQGPEGNPLDVYGWLLFISAHSERHTRQIEEVKADAGFPK